MHDKAVTLAVVAVLAVGASGVVAASTISPATAAAQPSGDEVQPANYTTNVVDPDDRLSDGDLATVRGLAWANESVRSDIETGSADDGAPVHFHVEALDGEVQVYVAPHEGAPPTVRADVDLASETITDVERVNDARTADDRVSIVLPSDEVAAVEDGETVRVATGGATIVPDDAGNGSVSMHPSPTNLTVVESEPAE
ncbi:hypothetical protein [Halomicrobium urmianum]|uniref:hypothetical protein n=1 Tax=Halomicrobium urmianum TaxID=1586233 RepID=UPI001CD9BE63|nr:hypothetical protein [Halomicrobium urmianum]